MLRSLRIQNFKGWKDTGQIRLAPLTVIFGANSAGKSSLGHLLLALKQTAQSNDNKRPLHLGDDKSMIDLGTFKECLHNHDVTQPLKFDLEWELPLSLRIQDVIKKKSYTGNRLSLAVDFSANKNDQPTIDSLEYKLIKENECNLNVKFYHTDEGKPELESSPLTLVRNKGKPWPLEEPLKFYRISDQSRARFQNADYLIDLALETEKMFSSIQYLGPLRDHPKRTYLWSGETPENVGQKGELAVPALLAAKTQERMLNRGPRMHRYPFDKFIANWLMDLGIIHDFSVKPVAEGRKEYEVLLKTHSKSSEVKITDVGIGVSQVLPALVQAFYCAPNSTVWMEQPEIHLHPQVQAELADVLISATQALEDGKERNTQIIMESHSEHFLNRLQRRVAEGTVSSEDVAVYFCRRAGSKTELEPLKLNLYGEIENWPENFFGDEMADISARSTAALSRKKKIDEGTNNEAGN